MTTFQSLTTTQQHTLLMAKLVRDALEDFHAKNLSDVQMKELNRIVRFGIYDAVARIQAAAESPAQAEAFARLIIAIPDYWEIPGRDPNPKQP